MTWFCRTYSINTAQNQRHFTNFVPIFHQNGQILINYVDENLADLKIPKELLLKASLMSCGLHPIEDQTIDCTAPGGMSTDFNIWDRQMGDKELIDWTTCK